jgi:peptide/nickel transport system substrate-binding protein
MATQSWLPTYVRRPVSRRGFLKASAAGAGAAALIACGGSDGGSGLKFDDASNARQPGTVWRVENDWKLADETKEAVRGGIYRGIETSDMSGHFDSIALMGSEVPFAGHVYEQLMARNRRPGVDPNTEEGQSPVPALAQDWEISSDGLTVTYTLRPNVKFHNAPPVNGRVMDMDDWKTSQERHLAIGVYRNFIGEILDKTEYPDARHMVWKLKFPYAPLVERMGGGHEFAYQVQPKELNADPDQARRIAVGTGFKILDKYQPSISFEYRKFAEYWGGDPFIDRWHFPIIPEYANRYSQFLNGNITSFTPTAREVLQTAKDVPGAVIVADQPENDRGSRYLFGIERPANDVFGDPRVRIAMRRSIDFRRIGEFLANKQSFEAAGIPIDINPMTHLPQNPAYWLNPEKGELGKLSENYLYDVAAAKALITAAGRTMPVPLTFAVQLSQGQIPEYDGLVIDSLRTSGNFELNLIQATTGAQQNLYRIDRIGDGVAWSGGGGVDPDYIMGRDWSNTYRTDNRQAFAHPRTEELFLAQRKTIDYEKRVQVLKDVQMWAAEWMMVVPAQHLFTRFSFRWPWVHNSNWGETSTDGRDNWGAHYQWLDEAMPRRNQGAA